MARFAPQVQSGGNAQQGPAGDFQIAQSLGFREPPWGGGRYRLILTDDSFVVPAGVTQIKVRVLAPGGASDAITYDAALSGNKYQGPILPGQIGGTVSFGALMSATGGQPGKEDGTGGLGGVGLGGDFQASGGQGGAGAVDGTDAAGGGGGAPGTRLGDGGNGGDADYRVIEGVRVLAGGGGGGPNGAHGGDGNASLPMEGVFAHGGVGGNPHTPGEPSKSGAGGWADNGGVYQYSGLLKSWASPVDAAQAHLAIRYPHEAFYGDAGWPANFATLASTSRSDGSNPEGTNGGGGCGAVEREDITNAGVSSSYDGYSGGAGAPARFVTRGYSNNCWGEPAYWGGGVSGGVRLDWGAGLPALGIGGAGGGGYAEGVLDVTPGQVIPVTVPQRARVSNGTTSNTYGAPNSGAGYCFIEW